MNFLLQPETINIVKGAGDIKEVMLRLSAYANVLKNTEYGIKRAIVLCNDNICAKGNVLYAPIYMLMFVVKQKDSSPMIFKPELSGLGIMQSDG